MVAHFKDTQILVTLVFGMFGFILAYYLRRGMSIVLFGILLYATLRGFEQLEAVPDWESFNKFVFLLQQLKKTLITLTNHMIAAAGTASLVLFLCGGIIGLVASMRGA
jgi:hypothetical protein